MFKNLFVSQKKAHKYVCDTSERIIALDNLNTFYSHAINESDSIMSLAVSFSLFVYNCRTMDEFLSFQSHPARLFSALSENNNDFLYALKSIYRYNLKAFAYKKIADKIWSETPSGYSADNSIISLQKYNKIESDVFSAKYSLKPISRDVCIQLRFSDNSYNLNYSFFELINEFNIASPSVDGYKVNDFLNSDSLGNYKGYYIIYNHTLRKLYVGFADKVGDAVYNLFQAGSMSDIYYEKTYGCDFFVRPVLMKIDNRGTSDTLNYLAWCYGSDDLQVKFLSDTKMSA